MFKNVQNVLDRLPKGDVRAESKVRDDRQIAEETAEHERQLAEARSELLAQGENDFPARWERVARRWRFDAVNELIARHNRFFPAEARLPMDPKTRDYALVNGRPYRIEPLGRTWILERFPARG